MAKLQGIQIGRGIAALAVVLFHAKLIVRQFPEDEVIKLPYFFTHGDIGVSFFFVISGFIISYVIDKDSFALRPFFIKRFFRIWPTYVFCTVVFVGIVLFHRNRTAQALGYDPSFLLSSIFILPMPDFPALQPGWSLEHEVLFYIFASILAALFKLRGLLLGLIVIVTASILYRVILPEFSGFSFSWDYHILATVNLCFLAGVGLYIFWKKASTGGDAVISHYWLIAGTVLILAAPYLAEFCKTFSYGLSNKFAINNTQKFIRFAIESIASVTLLYGMLAINSQLFLVRMLAAIGDRSYSLYLSHFILIPVFRYTQRELIPWTHAFAELSCIVFVVMAVLLSYVVHRWVEQPTSNYGVRLANQRHGAR